MKKLKYLQQKKEKLCETQGKEYSLETFHRSNQDTSLCHTPAVMENDWVEAGDLIADCSASAGGELALGKNILVAYMPWEGYNFEDSILISERLVYEEVYSSIHIERYEIETRETKFGSEKITRNIPELNKKELKHLDSKGVASIGSFIKEGDILVGRVTPINKRSESTYKNLLYSILNKPVKLVRDSSLRAPRGLKAKVINIQIYFKVSPVERNMLGELSSKKSFFGGPKVRNQSVPLVSSATTSNIRHTRTRLSSKRSKLGDQLLSLEGKQVSQPTTTKKLANPRWYKVIRKVRDRNLLLSTPTGLNSRWLGSSWNELSKPLIFFLSLSKAKDRKKKTNTLSYGLSFSEETDSLLKERENQKKRAKFNDQTSFKNSRGLSQKIKKTKNFFMGFFNGERPTNSKESEEDRGFGHPGNRGSTSIPAGGQSRVAKPRQTGLFLKEGKASKIASYKKNDHKELNQVYLYLAEKRKIQVGDKMAGRHGNKGIVSLILPRQDMPFLANGSCLDMVLNPLGVPSRMNVGQIYECLLGLASKYLGEHYKIFPFDEIYGPEASRSFVYAKLYEARQKTGHEWLFNPNNPGKTRIFDGRSGDPFDQCITVGYAYMLKLVHLVDDKIHMRSTGPYSLVTQQPLRGRSKQGGQRLGEMEVWALEGYGAAFTLLEMLTIKSDDMTGRMTLWSNLILNKDIAIGTPESFKVLVCELQALCLDIGIFRLNSFGNLIEVEKLIQLP